MLPRSPHIEGTGWLEGLESGISFPQVLKAPVKQFLVSAGLLRTVLGYVSKWLLPLLLSKAHGGIFL